MAHVERFQPGSGGPAIQLEHLHRYATAARLVQGAVLDLGCGVGYGSKLLAGHARRVIGLDASAAAITAARRDSAAPNLHYVQGDARCLPFAGGVFDWVVCFELLEHLREGETLIDEIARVLTRRGRLLLSTPNRPVYDDAIGDANPFHLREFDIAELRALLESRFPRVDIFGQRLVAGSVMAGLEEPAAREEVLALESGPAGERPDRAAPTYFLAVCARGRGREGSPAVNSVMTARLQGFVREEAARFRHDESALRGEYEHVIGDLTGRLAAFDARVRQLGLDVESHAAGRAADRVSFEANRAAFEQDRRRLERLLASSEESHAADIAKLVAQTDELSQRLVNASAELAKADADLAGLGSVLERTRHDLYWVHDQWQARLRELSALQSAKIWHAWMLYHRARRLASRLKTAAARAARRVGRLLRIGPGLIAGWFYLGLWSAWAWLGALRGGASAARRQGRAAAASSAAPRRPRILFVCPYPLHPVDHGGAVRIVNLIRRLSARCDIYLLVFIRAEDDPEQRRALEPWVKKLYFYHWHPAWKPDFFHLKPNGQQLFESPEVRALINDILSREQIDILQLEYTELGQYGLPRFARVKVVLSEIDICFRSRSRRRRVGMFRRYQLDRTFGHTLADWMRQFRYELRVARRADQVHVMSAADGAYLGRFLPGGQRKLRVVPNAVDVELYRPDGVPRGRSLLFVGNFDHLPNLDGLDFLMAEIWPRVRQRYPDAELTVVGARAGPEVYRHDGRDGVTVVGAVSDVVPYYQQCRALLAPIRAGSGTRLKILEALACASPVVTTAIGAEGIEGSPELHYLVAETPEQWADAIARVIADDDLCARLGRAGRELVVAAYSWERSADQAWEGYAALLGDGEQAAEPRAAAPSPRGGEVAGVDVSIVIPTLAGGALLERTLEAIGRQSAPESFEVVCVDSGSPATELEMMQRHGARVVRIDRSQFNHGLTRDLGAESSQGRVLVFLNQDAVPADAHWLERLTEPLRDDPSCAAVQGAIVEMPDPGSRFYWDSCGDRFYFTRDTQRWLERYFGIGFSTVNAAIRRDVWERHRFGFAPIMEDKKWQREVVAAGYYIEVAPSAAVYHTHDYDWTSLARRCRSEGFGWKTLGETYSLTDALADLALPRMYADLLRGLRAGRIRSVAELLFPVLRPLLLFRGNRWDTKVLN